MSTPEEHLLRQIFAEVRPCEHITRLIDMLARSPVRIYGEADDVVVCDACDLTVSWVPFDQSVDDLRRMVGRHYTVKGTS